MYALNSTERNNVVYEAENLAYRLWKLRFPTLVHVALLFSENNQHKIIYEKETPSIANCWRSNEKNEESRDKIKQYTRTLDDDDMVEHLDILDKETQLITEWTTLGNWKIYMGLGRRH